MKPTYCPGQHSEALHSALWLPARAKKTSSLSGSDCTPSTLPVNSQVQKSHVIVTRVHHRWLDLYFIIKGKDKKKVRPLPGFLTMYNIARWQSIKRGAVASQFLHLDWDFFSSVSLEAGISSINEHGYLLWQCHVWLKKVENLFLCLAIFFPLTSHTWWPRQVNCMWTSKGIYFLEKN